MLSNGNDYCHALYDGQLVLYYLLVQNNEFQVSTKCTQDINWAEEEGSGKKKKATEIENHLNTVMKENQSAFSLPESSQTQCN